MTPNEYQKLALRTENTPNIGPYPRVLHGLLGMATEIGELLDLYKKHLIYGKPFDRINLLEEVGDTYWYIALTRDACGVDMDVIARRIEIGDFPNSFNGGDVSLELLTRTINLHSVTTDALNTWLIATLHDLPLDIAEITNLCTFAQVLLKVILESNGFTVEQAQERNIAKLAKRYPDKFTSEAALNRDLDAERKILES